MKRLKPNKMENTIVVTIPCQQFSSLKYLADEGCYLHEALDKMGYKNICVTSFGRTSIGEENYNTKEIFHHDTVKDAFNAGNDITVTLTLIN